MTISVSLLHASVHQLRYVYTKHVCIHHIHVCVLFVKTRVQKTYILCITSVCFLIPFNRNIPVRIQHIKSTFMAVPRINPQTKQTIFNIFTHLYIHDRMKNKVKRDLQFGEIKLKRVMKNKFQIKPINYVFKINNGF